MSDPYDLHRILLLGILDPASKRRDWATRVWLRLALPPFWPHRPKEVSPLSVLVVR